VRTSSLKRPVGGASREPGGGGGGCATNGVAVRWCGGWGGRSAAVGKGEGEGEGEREGGL
jgi:hypothetical protein